MRKRIGYAKLGRSMPLTLERCGSLGGDVEMVPTLKLLAERHPDVDFIIIGRNSGEEPSEVGLPSNVHNPWIHWGPEVRRRINERGLNYQVLSIEDHIKVKDILCDVTGDTIQSLDGIVMWLGQHGTTNTPLPSIKDRAQLTKPYDWATLYASYLLQGINQWRDVDPINREEVLLNADVRNYVKYRDAKWPWRRSVLAQYNYTNVTKHERYGDTTHPSMNGFVGEYLGDTLWQSETWNVYSRLEISALMPGTPFGDTVSFSDDFNRPHDFGVVVNETRRQVNPARARVNVLRNWVLPLEPGFIHGKWSVESQTQLGRDIQPIPQLEYIETLQTARCTFTTPASGSGWATAKPWESFAAGVVCFFHPDYDDQDNILHDAPSVLRWYLRVESPEQLKERVQELCADKNLWYDIITRQRQHFLSAVAEKHYLHMIEERLGL